MKRSLVILLIGLVTFSCQEKEPRTDYVINGTAKGVYNGIRVYLGNIHESGRPIIKDTAIVMDEQFTFKGKVDNPEFHLIEVNGVKGKLAIMLENKDISIEIDKNAIFNSTVNGSKSHEEMLEYRKKLRLFQADAIEARRKIVVAKTKNDTSKLSNLQVNFDSLNDKAVSFPFKYIKNNPESYVAFQIFNDQFKIRGIDPQQIVDAYDNMDESLKQSDQGITLNKKINQLKIKLEAERTTAIGAKAPEFSAPNPDGEQIALSDVVSKGKITIIDFWAAWCGPCRRENPNVVKVYEEFHDKGLEIIGVSLDGRRGQKEPKQAWIDAIEKDGLTWHQVSNLRYFDDLAKSYNVNAIPAMFVLDENGIIVAKNLRGQMLRNKIAELLN